MVYVNSKKFACESCIKGHRSSSCHHTDRPLFEIKKKGRPVSQCEKCRELRHLKKVHSKCTCNPKDGAAGRGQVLASTTSKSRRFIPIVPALPNGLRDVLAASQVRSTLPADARQKVDSLLNPCNCRSVWKCECRQPNSPPTDKPSSTSTGGLSTLARAAATHCCDRASSPSSTTPLGHTAKITLSRTTSTPSSPSLSAKRHTPHPSSPQHHSHKRLKHHHSHRLSYPLELPPIQSPDSSPPTNQVPDFGFMPPISTIASLAGSGCTCGVTCACPGCVEHRGSEYAARDLHDCADGLCGTCVDNRLGVALPDSTSPFSSTSASSSSTASLDYITRSSSLNRFFARAAALPLPPLNRRLGNGVHLDPRDISRFPSQSDSTIANQVELPKLECCGGQCCCKDGWCCCGTSCRGCCPDSDISSPRPQSEPAPSPLSDVSTAATMVNAATISSVSCCAPTP